MKRVLLILLSLFFFHLNSYSSDSINKNIDKNFYKFLAAEGLVLTGAISYLKNQWYSDKKRVPFHFYNDLRGWNQVDKFGHFYASYLESNVGYSLMKKYHFSENQALFLGGSQGLILETPIEFFDAYYEGWGFSLSDMFANAFGSFFFISQQKIFGEQLIMPKLSFSRSNYAPHANGYLGDDSLLSQFVYDYNGYTYWFSFPLNKIFKKRSIPNWINIALGYGADGMIGEFQNKTSYKGSPIPSFERYRQYYLSLDIDFSKIKTNHKALEKLFRAIRYIKIPLPTIEFSNKKVRGYFFYF